MRTDLEQRTEGILRENGWEVITNTYYTDPNTSKPREKDIIASKTQFSDFDILSYEVRLFVECKNFPIETEIHTQQDSSGIENSLFTVNIPFANIGEVERRKEAHFYKYVEICGSRDSQDYLHEAINQTLQSFSAYRESNHESGLYYLLVVYDGELFIINQSSDKQKSDSALVQVKSIDNTFNLPNRKCLIEVVAISSLGALLEKIESDIQRVNGSSCFYYKMEKNRINETRRQKAGKISSSYR